MLNCDIAADDENRSDDDDNDYHVFSVDSYDSASAHQNKSER